MGMHKIEIDDEVMAYLKDRAEPLVDTANSVLRRELLERKPGRQNQHLSAPELDVASERTTSLSLPPDAPQALRQIVEVTVLVRSQGRARPDATQIVAKRHSVAPQTVLDKYCRQLDLNAAEFDALLREPELTKLRARLRMKFPSWHSPIESILSSLT